MGQGLMIRGHRGHLIRNSETEIEIWALMQSDDDWELIANVDLRVLQSRQLARGLFDGSYLVVPHTSGERCFEIGNLRIVDVREATRSARIAFELIKPHNENDLIAMLIDCPLTRVFIDVCL